ncbi:COP9 signalosome (CSN) subunit [Rhizophlyctis rosea]|uniref:Protein CSN12 homolog n=1 Tax=Rhizophlyctis rosea TaxID=64517 RepID=A0AAD5SCG8_9FUNG|nr:COP9 signalosome (CSN) subunit [Rhizophlyctis rosea]
MNQTNLVGTIMRSVANADLVPLERYPLADQVTFKYYTGILAFFEEKYQKAEEDLSFALERCLVTGQKQSEMKKNKSQILNYLLPTRLLRGTLPHPALFAKYPAIEATYGNFAKAIREGDVRLFDESLMRGQRELVKRGTWLAVERVRGVAVRVLFRKTWLIYDKATRIPMTAFQDALRYAGTEVELDEVQCMLANMIDRGYLKGYLSYEKRMVVLSKGDAFPPVATVPI